MNFIYSCKKIKKLKKYIFQNASTAIEHFESFKYV